MKNLIYLIALLILISCENHKSNNVDNHDVNKQKANKNVELLIPDEINNKIDKTVVFAIANIGLWDGDYIGNTLYVLYKNKKVKRISNNKLPENGSLFCTELQNYFDVDSIKYNTFINYLLNLSDTINTFEYKMPEDLDVSGGSMNYVYINVEKPGFWISFEPESSVLLSKIETSFDNQFK
ncbi:MAG: hypothetical protein JXA16_02640 [Bacteroidales bacterium]|nr:hypothetical protein [Bacteroidales bacterium]